MHARFRIVCSYLALMILTTLYGCISSPTEPFKEWGAAERYNEFVPATAQTVAQGTGKLTFTAPERGTLYLLDTSDMIAVKETQQPKALGSGLISKGDQVTFDPQEKRVYRTGREGVRFTDVDPSHTHEFRFDPLEKRKTD